MVDLGTLYFRATAATGISAARYWRMAVSCSSESPLDLK